MRFLHSTIGYRSGLIAAVPFCPSNALFAIIIVTCCQSNHNKQYFQIMFYFHFLIDNDYVYKSSEKTF